MSETHAEFRARLKRERKARTEASRAALAAYYAEGPLAIALERIARGEVTTIAVAADGTRTVTHGHGLDASGRPLRTGP